MGSHSYQETLLLDEPQQSLSLTLPQSQESQHDEQTAGQGLLSLGDSQAWLSWELSPQASLAQLVPSSAFPPAVVPSS